MLQDEIQKLRSIYVNPADQQTLTDIEKELRRRLAQSKTANIDEVKTILDLAYQEIRNINFLLAYDETLSDAERRAIFRERKVHQFYLERFGAWDAQRVINEIEDFVKTKLSTNQNP